MLDTIYRDVRLVIPSMLQLAFYALAGDVLGERRAARWQWLYHLNPFVGIARRVSLVPHRGRGTSGRFGDISGWSMSLVSSSWRRHGRLRAARALCGGSSLMTTVLDRSRGLGKRFRLGEDVSGNRLRQMLRRSPYRAGAPRSTSSGRCAMSRSRSSPARRSASSAATARARARCSSSCRGSPSRPKGARSLRGRVGTLLEVGTGFHPELTGRDNIFLSGTILGMTYGEVAAQIRRDRRFRRSR